MPIITLIKKRVFIYQRSTLGSPNIRAILKDEIYRGYIDPKPKTLNPKP